MVGKQPAGTVVLHFQCGKGSSFSSISCCGKLAVAKNGGSEGADSSLAALR
jgi:hypothetical protein